MKILPILRALQGKGFDSDTLMGMSCNALCLQRLRNGIGSPPVDPNSINQDFFGDENDAIQNFFLVHGELAQNDLNVLIASDVFLRKRAHQIDFDQQYGALPCLVEILRADINDHKQFLINGALQLMNNGDIPTKRMHDFEFLTTPITWSTPPQINADTEDEDDLPPAPKPE